ncbi:MAG: hypothetical protein LAT81_11950, partial [Oceanicaulis sp.]|nr:hypothetical protein [Oceanicaulis sp.]
MDALEWTCRKIEDKARELGLALPRKAPSVPISYEASRANLAELGPANIAMDPDMGEEPNPAMEGYIDGVRMRGKLTPERDGCRARGHPFRAHALAARERPSSLFGIQTWIALPDDHEDRGLYITEGTVEIAGQEFEAGRMMVFRPGDRITVRAGE